MPTNSAELEAYKERAQTSVNTWLTPVTLLLKSKGVTKVDITYSGAGDSGQIDDFNFMLEDGTGPLSAFTAGFDQAQEAWLEQLIYDILESRGWEVNNEGSHGRITWNIEEDTMLHEHVYHDYGDCEEDHDHKTEDCYSAIVDAGNRIHTGCDDLVGGIELRNPL